MSLTGHRTEKYRVELLSKAEASLGDLDGVVGGSLSWNANADLPGGGSIQLDDLGQTINFSSDRLRIWCSVTENVARTPEPTYGPWAVTRVNYARNPQPLPVGLAVDWYLRYGWGRVFSNDGYDVTFTCPSSQDSAGRGWDIQGNVDLATPAVIDPEDDTQVTVTAGVPVTVSVNAKSNKNLNMYMVARITNGSGGWVGLQSVGAVKAVGPAGARLSVTITPTANGYLQAGTRAQPGVALVNGDVIRGSQALIEKGTTEAKPYFDELTDPNGTLTRTSKGGSFTNKTSIMEEREIFTYPTEIVSETNEWPLGVYVMAAPSTSYSANVRSRSVTLIDKLTAVKEDCLVNTLQFDAGTNIVDAVIAQIQAAGEARIAATPSTKTISTAMTWAVGTSRLRVINDLLAAAGYWALWTDRYGQYRVEPYTKPADRAVVWEFAEGETSVHSPDWQYELPLWDATNKVIMVSQADDAGVFWIAEAADNNPNSPTSIVSMGRVINPIVEENVEAITQADLQSQADRKLIDNSNVVGKLSVSHAVLPLWYQEAVQFDSQGMSTKATITQMSIQLSPGSLMTAEWSQA